MPSAPPPARPETSSGYFEELSKAVFGCGISLGVVEARWGGLRTAFAGFDPWHVATFSSATVDRLMSDARIVRNRAKIEATIANAAEMLVLEQEHGSFRQYLRSHATVDDVLADLTRRFQGLGEADACFFLEAVGEDVPPHERESLRRPRLLVG